MGATHGRMERMKFAFIRPYDMGGGWADGRMGEWANFIRWIIRPYDMGANGGGWAWYAVGGSDVEDTRLHIM